MTIRKTKNHSLPESLVTPEPLHDNRRQVLRKLGLGAVSAIGLVAARWGLRGANAAAASPVLPADIAARYPAPVNSIWSADETGRVITPEARGTGYNNFYEFTASKKKVKDLAARLVTRPWTIEIGGLVERPMVIDVDDLTRRFELEERVYRMRCVEAWSMVLPWTGFALRALMDLVRPLAAARYVRFWTFLDPAVAPGQKNDYWYPWPYYEALRIDEAAHDLTMLATGIYGKPLPPQNGAPIRLVVPWKYGYKSIKSIVAIEFVRERPRTFWNDLAPAEYDFDANVDPSVPHPRWSQAREVDLGTKTKIATLPFNGYGELVAGLYRK